LFLGGLGIYGWTGNGAGEAFRFGTSRAPIGWWKRDMPELVIGVHKFDADFRAPVFPDLDVNYGTFDFFAGRGIDQIYDLSKYDRLFKAIKPPCAFTINVVVSHLKISAVVLLLVTRMGMETARRWLRRGLTN
jgi:hypothetical protein